MSKAKVMTIFGMMVLLCALIQSNIASAATFTVGDSKGWTFNVAGWENGKSFKAGDVLVFNYPKGVHTVVGVGQNGYNTCNPSAGQVFTSGSDRITLKKGGNFFICGVDSHCKNFGMKIAVNAS
ncbi:hypothetical protein ACH5RR_022507 [Cinchona calisaya]|uniref:Basic blue protein n=1 Tax=Cinchona calisaya TaxID=153742 RepID=A0ABD2ZBA3_9GENT